MSEAGVDVSLRQVTEILDVLVRHAAARAPSGEVTVEEDAYWSVPPNGAHDIYGEPPELTIGSVSESLAQLRAMLDDESRVVGYGFVWLGDVLRAVGARMI
ncbi:hypothetical protein RM844_15430 [Streptomyces sp. DSM 44915]|uniref:Uncharacterized protein n=1 Tax=Streptomyces chisholmiae TaxID=3075540 RepID=A0ABU2JRR1_9ACTN|nr:hypothetical protein [Streptomyces sp. DSM 44915]MDT0267678.1 hypothetical protein [Streptomyces sp. DSM 44915]